METYFSILNITTKLFKSIAKYIILSKVLAQIYGGSIYYFDFN